MSSIAQTICLTGEWWLVAGGCPLSRQPCRAHMPCSLRRQRLSRLCRLTTPSLQTADPDPDAPGRARHAHGLPSLGAHTSCRCRTWRALHVAHAQECSLSCTKQPGRPHRPFPRPGDVGGGPCIVLDVSALKLDGHLPNSVATDSRRGAPNRGLGDARTAYAECTSEH